MPGPPGRLISMRWDELFADLEAELAALERADLLADTAEHTRIERARVTLVDRLAAAGGLPLAVRLRGGTRLRGVVVGTGPDWLLLDDGTSSRTGSNEILIALASVCAYSGLPVRVDTHGQLARRLDLRHALRAIARDRATVQVHDTDAGVVVGTVQRVGRDHLDLAVHPDDQAPRRRAVRETLTVPFAALVLVRRL